MTGEQLVGLMRDKHMRRIVHRAARRYTKCPEDIEEYMDDAWMRIAECHADKTPEYYANHARRAVHASYMQRWRVHAEKAQNVNGISESPTPNVVPKNAIPLGRGRYLKYKPEKLSQWYYDGEWKEYGLDKDAVQVRSFYEIVVVTT